MSFTQTRVNSFNFSCLQHFIKKSGSVYHVSSSHWFSDSCNRLLALRQLLVSRSRGSRGYCGLTITETSPQQACSRRGGKRISKFLVRCLYHRQRLALRGIIEWRLHKSVTSDSTR
ncbi:hypothetical protein WA026_001245 [Henosepilachna vigintioctopunctata]|uniref:Uncharacterized protein n=1 Tax=Henosepilachna vigintioctopunctata TaxID=420089 RepID=A0AAW1UR87_9CUCU